MSGDARLQRAVELVRRLAAALRSSQLYAPDHPIIARNFDQLIALIGSLLSEEQDSTVVIGVLGEKIIVGDLPVGDSDSHLTMIRRLRRIGVERLTIERGVTRDELAALITAVNTIDPSAHPPGEPPPFPALPHVRVGRVTVERDEQYTAVDMAAYRRLYAAAVTTAETVWQSALVDGQPDPGAARTMVDGLAEAVSQNRTALLALTTLKEYDNYTFTHMVNVSLLTMGQARGLGIDGPLLREFGLAALMHDIGKVRIPLEILNKPEKLSNDEFEIMKGHAILGAEILRATPDIPTLAPVVAFEHHLRMNGSGYPAGVRRSTLNLGTTLCSIADVYDAMRSQRKYQQAFPTERILAVLQNDAQQFDAALVRRFVQLLGIYPTGTLVRLDTGELAIVTEAYAPDPHRPEVRIIEDRHGQPLDPPRVLSLWAAAEGEPQAIVTPVDPREAGIDPLTLIETGN